MKNTFTISEDDLAAVERAIQLLHAGKYVDAMVQVGRVEQMTKRIRANRRQTEEALNEITVAVKGFQSALIVGELNVSGTLNM